MLKKILLMKIVMPQRITKMSMRSTQEAPTTPPLRAGSQANSAERMRSLARSPSSPAPITLEAEQHSH
jgi:hypothetical protein